MQKYIQSFKSLNIFEIVLTLVLAVAIGISMWGWTFVYDFFKPFFKIYGLQYLSAGYWIFPSLFLSLIIRKPGIALIASIMAAFVESLLTKWGIISVVWGIAQGLGAEIIFFLFAYKKWDLKTTILASMLSTLLSYGLDYYFYEYHLLSPTINFIQLSSFLASSLFLAAILSHKVAFRLNKLGLLDQFLIAKENPPQ